MSEASAVSTTACNVLLEKTDEPTAQLVSARLGATAAFWAELLALTGGCEQDWKHYGKKYGWKLKIHAKDKTLLELTVADGWFLLAMAIREKERETLRSGAHADLATDGASFPEGYGVRIEVRDRASFDRARALVSFIMAERGLA
jgi:hypothetical protein